jgi:hypothetical protein
MRPITSGDTVIVDIIFRSESGRSLRDRPAGVGGKDLSPYEATEETRQRAVRELCGLGFKIVGQATSFGVTISGPSRLVRNVFGEGELRVPSSLLSWIESARIPPPGEFYER